MRSSRIDRYVKPCHFCATRRSDSGTRPLAWAADVFDRTTYQRQREHWRRERGFSQQQFAGRAPPVVHSAV